MNPFAPPDVKIEKDKWNWTIRNKWNWKIRTKGGRSTLEGISKYYLMLRSMNIGSHDLKSIRGSEPIKQKGVPYVNSVGEVIWRPGPTCIEMGTSYSRPPRKRRVFKPRR